MRETDGGGGWSATTKFDQYSHAQLFDMVNDSAPAGVSSIANTLSSASTQIQSIADDLNTHITHLQWDGAAGDSFRSWGRQVVQAMDDLSVFHNNASVAMQTAGDTLSSVKAAMPPVPTSDMNLLNAYIQQESCQVSNPPAVINGRVQSPTIVSPTMPGQIRQSDAYAAQGRIDAAHQEAIAQMEKLGGAYNGATQTMDINAEPQFPPTPSGLMPPRGSGIDGSVDTTGPSGSKGGGTVSSVGGGGGWDGHHGSNGGTGTGSGTGGGGTIHQAPLPPGQSGGISTLQGTHPPVAGPGPVQSPGTPGGSGAPGSPGSGAGHGPGGGGIVAPPVTGTGGYPPGRGSGPVRGGGGSKEPVPPGEGAGAGEPGVHGGGVSAGRGLGGGIGAGGLGGAGGGRLRGGLGAGLAGGAGADSRSGIVGGEGSGSSTARAGMPAEEAPGAGVAGGANGEAAGGPMMGGGMGGLGGGAGRGRSRAGRAAYLSEDQETWASGSDVNPAVIE